MTRTTAFSAILFGLVCFSACKKDDDNPKPTVTNPYPLVGLWIGTTTLLSSPSTPPGYYSLDIRSDNTIIVQGQGSLDGETNYGNGTWQLNGHAFSATMTIDNLNQTGVVQTITATYDSTEVLSNGQLENNGDLLASFELRRVP